MGLDFRRCVDDEVTEQILWKSESNPDTPYLIRNSSDRRDCLLRQ